MYLSKGKSIVQILKKPQMKAMVKTIANEFSYYIFSSGKTLLVSKMQSTSLQVNYKL